jgi:MFS family permease
MKNRGNLPRLADGLQEIRGQISGRRGRSPVCLDFVTGWPRSRQGTGVPDTRGPRQAFPIFLLAFVLASGMAAGGNPPVFAAFLIDRLQGPRLGFLLGLQNIGFGLGATPGPFLAGALFDLTGSYTFAFVLMAASIVASSVIVAGVTRRPTTPPR